MISDKTKVVLCHGCFDLLHIGHIKYLKKAKEFGNKLIVGITSDRYVNKGNNRPFFNQTQRKEMLESISFVDKVIINNHKSALELIKEIKPDYYIKGIEYLNSTDSFFLKECDEVLKYNGKVRFTKTTKYSSSNVINKLTYNDDIIKFMEQFKYSYEYIKSYINNLLNLKVLVIGEVVSDEYIYGNHLGKIRRDNLLEFGVNSEETFIGGSGAVVNHMSEFVNHIDLLTLDNIKGEGRIKGNIIKINTDKQPYRKLRFIEKDINNRNLFKISYIDDTPIDEKQIIEILDKCIDKYDLVVVIDYGHGMISNELAEHISNLPIYLAVSTQINTENMGFNTIDKYNNVDFGCINEYELRKIMKSKDESTPYLMERLKSNMTLNNLIVTRGPHGLVINNKIIPSISDNIVDTMGAGDALYSISSLLAYIDAPEEVIGFVGNVTGYMHSNIIGNKEYIKKEDLLNQIRVLLK